MDADSKSQEVGKTPISEIKYSASAGLSARLAKMNTSVAFTSYQSNLLYFVGLNAQGGINVHQSMMPKPMGISRNVNGGLTLACDYQILKFENVLNENEQINETFDACYVPRVVSMTGRLDAHDVGVDADGNTIFVNTRYNCLARTSTRHSFEEVWRPPFITELVDEDRCHLNGLAMENGQPRYVTAVSRSNTIDGWRDRRDNGGVIIDVVENRIVCEGLSMPHSPRMVDGVLWVFNSGSGELGEVEFDAKGNGSFKPRAFCPGFLRGLVVQDGLAFVGLSKPRYERFEGLALDQRLKDADSEPWCGMQVIDLSTGACLDWLRIDGAVSELYDLDLLPGHLCPMAVSPQSPDIANFITF